MLDPERAQQIFDKTRKFTSAELEIIFSSTDQNRAA